MVDRESVERRLREMAERLGELAAVLAAGNDAFQRDAKVRKSVERDLQVLIQAALDVTNHILAEDTDQTPEDYGGAFLLLAKHGVIEDALASRLRDAAGLRNLLVHGYLKVDPRKVWAALEHLEDLEAFSASVERYLERA